MSDLLARLAQRPPKPNPRHDSASYLDDRAARAEYDRDLALDALEAFVKCDGGGCYHADACGMGPCKADQDARAILRELRPQHGEGDGHADTAG